MKKTLIALFLVGAVLFTPIASAQTVNPNQPLIDALQKMVELYTRILNILIAQSRSPINEPVVNQPIVNQPVNTGVPVINQDTTQQVVIPPSCNLSVSEQDRTITVSWTSNNIPTSTVGALYDDFYGRYDGGVPEYTYIRDLPTNSTTSNQGSVGQIAHARLFKAVFGDTVCYAQIAQ